MLDRCDETVRVVVTNNSIRNTMADGPIYSVRNQDVASKKRKERRTENRSAISIDSPSRSGASSGGPHSDSGGTHGSLLTILNSDGSQEGVEAERVGPLIGRAMEPF
jgi:hypothetical protein